VEQREELLEERACVPTGQEFLLHSPKNAPGSALSFVLSGPQVLVSNLFCSSHTILSNLVR
jgi:hypothetical protein